MRNNSRFNESCGNCKQGVDTIKNYTEKRYCLCYLYKDHPVMLKYEHCTKWESKYQQPEQLKLL